MNLTSATDHIERVMIESAPIENSCANPYLAGYIDAMHELGAITEEIRAELYVRYADRGIVRGVNGPDININ